MWGIIFTILWIMSIFVWLSFLIKTIIDLKNDRDYWNHLIGLNISLVFMLIFNLVLHLC